VSSQGRNLVNVLHSARSPIEAGRVALTAGVALLAIFCIVVPRIGPLAVIVCTMLASVVLLFHEFRTKEWGEVVRTTFVRPEILFGVWTIIACLWAVAPFSALSKAACLTGFTLHAIVLSRHIVNVDLATIADISRGLAIGFCVGALYLFIEITMADFIGRAALTYVPEIERGVAKHAKMADGVITSISGAHMSRVSAVLCLMWCPAVLASLLYFKGIAKWAFLGVAAVIALTILLHRHSHSQTAELALFVGLVFLAIAAFSVPLARWLAGVSFVALLFLIVPLSLGMYALKLHENPDLFKSGRARVVIWNYTAERILENPVLGIGTYSTRYLDEQRLAEAKQQAQAAKLVVPAQTRAHPHNIYLHVWYELGVIGALAFAFLGISLLLKVDQLRPPASILAIGHFAICMIVISSTYGLWQNWFQSAFVLSILVLILVASPMLIRSRQDSTEASPLTNGGAQGGHT
jgi:hypothetical protein